MNGKKSTIIFICIFSAMIFTACSRLIPFPKHNIHTSYKEWAEQIGLYSTKNVKVSCYEGENEIAVGLEYENDDIGYKELCDVINKHNKFVDDNPDYFPNGLKISFDNSLGDNQPTKSVFFNEECLTNAISDYLGDLKRPYTAKIQYMYVDMFFADEELKEKNIEIDVPVIILLSTNSQEPNGRAFGFLKEFKKAEQVIMDFRGIDYNKDEICADIREYLPNVEIYAVESNDGKYHLEKCR